MAGTVTFILKEPQATTKTPVYLVFWYNQIRIKISTGERLHPNNWNKITHKARETKDFAEGPNINTTLETHRINVLNAVRDHIKTNGVIMQDKLKAELIKVVRPPVEQEQEPMTFFKSIEEYIRISNKAPRTKINYDVALDNLKEYQKTIKEPITYESINIDFYEEYMNFLTHVKGYAKNTIGTRIKNLKVFMNYANDKHYTNNQGHRHLKFRKVEETAETIYLSDKEIMTLYHLDLTKNKKLDRVRDLFIIGCYTGLRFSDLSQITPDKITNNGTRLRVKTIKTGETVVIPLHPAIVAILKKYDSQLPRVISNQKFNDYLKDLGEQAELTENVSIAKTKRGLQVDTSYNKFQLITVHTARRSFATNMFLAGVPSISIMKITGHRTEKAFMKYIKITQEQNADLIAKHPYFKKAPMRIAK
jgi:integrase